MSKCKKDLQSEKVPEREKLQNDILPEDFRRPTTRDSTDKIGSLRQNDLTPTKFMFSGFRNMLDKTKEMI